MSSGPRRGVGVIAMVDVGLDTMRRVESVREVVADAAGLQLFVPGMMVEVFIDCCWVADGVGVTH